MPVRPLLVWPMPVRPMPVWPMPVWPMPAGNHPLGHAGNRPMPVWPMPVWWQADPFTAWWTSGPFHCLVDKRTHHLASARKKFPNSAEGHSGRDEPVGIRRRDGVSETIHPGWSIRCDPSGKDTPGGKHRQGQACWDSRGGHIGRGKGTQLRGVAQWGSPGGAQLEGIVLKRCSGRDSQ